MYKVITWDEQNKCTHYREVVDAIDCDDATQVVQGMYPNEKVLGVTSASLRSASSSANENQ